METLRIAAEALRRHLLRSILTLFGVIIGVMTIVAVVSVISGLNNYVTTQLFTLSPDVFIATQFGIITSQEEFLEAVKRKRLEMSDLRAIREHCRTCGTVSAQINDRMSVRRNGRQLGGVVVFGGSANLADTKNVDIEVGRFFTASEDAHGAAVAVIGTDIRDELFARLDPIGRTFKVNGFNFVVIGVLKKQGSVLGQNQDNQLYVPLTTFTKNFGARRSIGIGIRPLKGIPGMNECMDEVRVILRSRRHTAFRAKDPFSFVTAEAFQAVWRSISASSFALMTFISGISLVVGGIVITNIMLVSVVERTREIGIRRAIGARRGDILRQFLTEAALLSFIGGLLGVLLGFIISKVIAAVAPLPTLVKPSLIISGLSIAVITGLVAGVFPAVKAARLPPVEALRYE